MDLSQIAEAGMGVFMAAVVGYIFIFLVKSLINNILAEIRQIQDSVHNELAENRKILRTMQADIKESNKLDQSSNQILKAISNFSGVKRRFDKYQYGDFVYIDDYAHHPKEIEATLKAVQQLYPDKKLTVVFQPHLFAQGILIILFHLSKPFHRFLLT